MRHFAYINNELFCEGVALNELAAEFGTPLYVYSKNQIADNINEFTDALAPFQGKLCYAVKANHASAVLDLVAKRGLGADVVSGGELRLALAAGIPLSKLFFAGVGKREDELEYAVRAGIQSINVESIQELHSVSKIALRLQMHASVSIRVNPDIDAHSHPYISTGLRENKFGMDATSAFEAFLTASKLPNIILKGIHTHIGSQITTPEPFAETARFIVQFLSRLKEAGITLAMIDFGGGMGIRYRNALAHEAIYREPEEDNVPTIAEFVQAFMPILAETGCEIWVEPGRAIVGNAGVLITKVLYTKENKAKKFAITDAGMTELLRPTLYQAYHQIVPTTIDTLVHESIDIVGPVCESGDFFAKNRMMNIIKPGSRLAILTTGAYGAVLSSQYNARSKPREVMVNEDRIRIIPENR